MGKKKGGGAVRIKQVGPKPGALANMAQAPINPMEAMQIPQEELAQLEPVPIVNRKYQIYWPIMESLTMETKKFQVIYPSYIDGTKTLKQGRRIGKEIAVGPQPPNVSDISLALQNLKIRHVIQPYKGYSRDITCQWENPGRVLVDVSDMKKTQLMKTLANNIPSLPQRHRRLEQEAAEKIRKDEQKQKRIAAAAAAEAKKPLSKGGGGANATSNSKKKGKKGKRK